MTTIDGSTVRLRPYRTDEMPFLLDYWRDAEWFAPQGTQPQELADRVAKRIDGSGSFANGAVNYAIEHQGRLVGEINARQPVNGLPPGVYEIGIELFDAANRGHGLGSAAVATLSAHLIDEGAHRVQLTTDVDNRAMRSVCESLGFSFEGVLRGFMPTADGPRDYAMYAITRDDYEEVKPGWISTD